MALLTRADIAQATRIVLLLERAWHPATSPEETDAYERMAAKFAADYVYGDRIRVFGRPVPGLPRVGTAECTQRPPVVT